MQICTEMYISCCYIWENARFLRKNGRQSAILDFFKSRKDGHHPQIGSEHNPEYQNDPMKGFCCAVCNGQNMLIFRRKMSASRPSWIFSKFRKDGHHPQIGSQHNPEYQRPRANTFCCREDTTLEVQFCT